MKNKVEHSGSILKLHSRKHFFKNLTRSFITGFLMIATVTPIAKMPHFGRKRI